LRDSEYAKKTNFSASVEFFDLNGKIDTVSIRNAIDKELKAQSSTYTFDFKVLGMTNFNANLVCDKYVLYYYENGNEELMKMSIYQFYTTKRHY
jgi:antitoxin component YwqK of YwqJK toxin-antitoxin module